MTPSAGFHSVRLSGFHILTGVLQGPSGSAREFPEAGGCCGGHAGPGNDSVYPRYAPLLLYSAGDATAAVLRLPGWFRGATKFSAAFKRLKDYIRQRDGTFVSHPFMYTQKNRLRAVFKKADRFPSHKRLTLDCLLLMQELPFPLETHGRR